MKSWRMYRAAAAGAAGASLAMSSVAFGGGVAPIVTETQKLLASDGAPSDKFGFALEREGDTLIIGAPQHYTNALPGSFYEFARGADGVWTEQVRIFSDYQPGEEEFGDVFGEALALEGDVLLVGAPFAVVDGADLAGRIYVYERDAQGAWVNVQHLLPQPATPGMRFGQHIVMVGDTAVVGGLQRAWVYTRDGSGVWSEQTELQGFDLDVIRAVAFDGQRIALTSYEFPTEGPQAVIFTAEGDGWSAGAEVTSSAPGFLVTSGAWFVGGQFAMGINDLNAPDYVFLFGADGSGGWAEQAVLTNPDTEDPYPNIHDFGSSIHGDGGAMIVGARQGNRAYLYRGDGAGGWEYAVQLRPSDAYVLAKNFGDEVHLRDNIAVVGSWAHHENGLYSGAAYVFDGVIPAPPVCPGDADGDGAVNTTDLNIVLSDFGCASGPANCPGDLDGDGDTDTTDLNLVLSAFGAVCP